MFLCVCVCVFPLRGRDCTPVQVISAHPDRPERIEPYQLRHIALFYTLSAGAVNKYGSLFGGGTRRAPRLRLPLLHIGDVITRLSQPQLTDLASLFTSVAEFNIPRDVRWLLPCVCRCAGL